VAVVDDTGHFLGFIPPPRTLAVLLWEHEEDLARLGGFQHNALAARQASPGPGGPPISATDAVVVSSALLR
jgi:hypothetical protein